MKKKIAIALLLLLCPTIVLAQRYGGYSSYGRGSYGYYRPAPYYARGYSHYHNNDWIVPAAVFGTVLGVAALSRPYAYAQPVYAQPVYAQPVYAQPVYAPPPPRRICRDTYNHYDQSGRYTYTTYVDRPCD
jgi:hypothetical protein